SANSIVDVTNVQSNPQSVTTYEDYEIEDKCYDVGGENNDEPVNKVEKNPDEEQDEDQEELGEL
ncbi:2764_t:CDS:1, partial [Racocetra fulgida]